MTTVNFAMNHPTLLNDGSSNDSHHASGGGCGGVDRISSAPNPIIRSSSPKPSKSLVGIDRSCISKRKSRGRLSLRQSIISGNAKERISIKFSPKNFVTKWAGGLEDHYEMGDMLGR